ncbi:hypothetical protein B5S32_g425 [[Candida] boidinii]|nr:hypothetical protein B5S32_g425 [[Candida] boidinii]
MKFNSVVLSSAIALSTNALAADSASSTVLGYAPIETVCPAVNSQNVFAPTDEFEGFLRPAISPSKIEKAWINGRHEKTDKNLIEFLDNLDLKDFQDVDFEDYITNLNSSINIAFAASGGGLRAMLSGAGQISAFDKRTNYDGTNKLAGLLDSATYIAGLSGGSWLVSSLVFHDWIGVQDILDNKTSIWNLEDGVIPTDLTIWEGILAEANQKKQEGYELSVIDLYGLLIGRAIFTDLENQGAGLTWSSLREIEKIQSFDMPYPIILALGTSISITENDTYDSNDVALFEVSPFEFGSWQNSVNAFTDIKHIASKVVNGIPVDDNNCTVGFDSAPYLIGSSSDIFTALGDLTTANLSTTFSGIPTSYLTLIQQILGNLNSNSTELAYSIVQPNPFYENEYSEEEGIYDGETMLLVDGGWSGEGVPLDPFIQPSREIDVVVIFDNDGDSNDSWPLGATLFETEERVLHYNQDLKFYDLPSSIEEFVELGLNKRPVFFGCNGDDLLSHSYGDEDDDSDDFAHMLPLLIYFPNSYMTFSSNTSTLQLEYTNEERNAMIQNGFEVATRMNFTLDAEFAECVGCAVLRRSQERLGAELGDQCSQCFNRYCYVSDNTTDVFTNEKSEDEETPIWYTDNDSIYNIEDFDEQAISGSASGAASGSAAGSVAATGSSSAAASSSSGAASVSSKGSGSTLSFSSSTVLMSYIVGLTSFVMAIF